MPAADRPPGLHVDHLVIDCRDPAGLAAFWTELLDTEVEMTWHQYVILRPTREGAAGLAFQRVPEPKAGKNRVHLDLMVPDLAPAVERAVALGAATLDRHRDDGVEVQILADPEGNEFCLVHVAG